MTFSIHESIDPSGAIDLGLSLESYGSYASSAQGLPILQEKIRVPIVGGQIPRPRLDGLLEKSTKQFPATLICGRSGTGKTAIAAAFTKAKANTSWFTVESTDIDWTVFARYLSESLGVSGPVPFSSKPEEISTFLAERLGGLRKNSEASSLIVLDDIHHIFDAPWFGDFFNLLIYSLPANVHLILLCRSRPPGPLWRLRSKQMLNVLDEKVIAFSPEEAAALFKAMKLPAADAKRAFDGSFGRVSKLLRYAEEKSTLLPSSA